MDNFTHSFAGLLQAELTLQYYLHRRKEISLSPGWLSLTCILANNLPDSDLLFSWLTPQPLNYLLHHRGITHTVLAAPLLAILATALLILIMRNRKCAPLLFFSLATGSLVHIFLDSFNIYGVHPFWPWYNGWIYGDSLFILEPTLWCLGAVLLYSRLSQSKLRFLLLGFCLSLPFALYFVGFYHPVGFLVLALIPVLGYSTDPRLLALRNLFGWMTILFIFALCSYWNKLQVRQHFTAGTMEIATDPVPSSPFCWNTLVLIRESEQKWSVHSGSSSLIPTLIPAKTCPNKHLKGGLKGDQRSPDNSPQIYWRQSYSIDVEQMLELFKAREDFAAWLRFARLPIVRDKIAQDLRFSILRQPNFASLVLGEEVKKGGLWPTTWTHKAYREIEKRAKTK